MPEPPKPGAGPFALAASGILEEFVESAGLKVVSGESVPVVFHYENLEDFIRAQFSSGPSQNAIATIGAEAFRNAITEFFAEHQGGDGALRLNNTFRFVTTMPA